MDQLPSPTLSYSSLNPAGAARPSRRAPSWPAAVVVWGLFLICCGLPLAWMLVALISSPHAIHALQPVGFHLRLLGRTLAWNAGVAAIATLLALPVAIVLGNGRGVALGVLAFLLPAALLLPSIVYAYGWMQVLRVGNVFPMPGTAGDVARCVWTLGTWLWPIPAGVIGLALRRLDADLQQQAMLDGGYWRVVGRQLAAPAAASLAIVAILAMQEFAVYEPTGISVVATEVRTVFETGEVGLNTGAIASVQSGTGFTLSPSDQAHNAAAALVTALPLLTTIAVLGIAALFVLRHHVDAPDAIDVGPRPRVLQPGMGVTLLAFGVVGVALVLPIATMIGSVHRAFDLERVWRTFSPPVLGTVQISPR